MRLAEHLLSLSTICKHWSYESSAKIGNVSIHHFRWRLLGILPSGSKVGSKVLSHGPITQQASHPSLLNSHMCTSFPSARPLHPSTHHPISIDATKNTRSQPTHALDAQNPQLKAKCLKRGCLTFVNPISWLFSLKHCRQILRPYFRIRPALCVQTRLLRESALNGSLSKTIFRS